MVYLPIALLLPFERHQRQKHGLKKKAKEEEETTVAAAAIFSLFQAFALHCHIPATIEYLSVCMCVCVIIFCHCLFCVHFYLSNGKKLHLPKYSFLNVCMCLYSLIEVTLFGFCSLL